MDGGHELTCKESVELVTDYLEGALEAPARIRFEGHLVLCPGCEIYLEQMGQTARLIGRIPEEPEAGVPPEVRTRLLAAFRRWSALRDHPGPM